MEVVPVFGIMITKEPIYELVNLLAGNHRSNFVDKGRVKSVGHHGVKKMGSVVMDDAQGKWVFSSVLREVTVFGIQDYEKDNPV